jgi:hypothetical protein
MTRGTMRVRLCRIGGMVAPRLESGGHCLAGELAGAAARVGPGKKYCYISNSDIDLSCPYCYISQYSCSVRGAVRRHPEGGAESGVPRPWPAPRAREARKPLAGHYDPCCKELAARAPQEMAGPETRNRGPKSPRSGAPRGAASRSQGTPGRLASVPACSVIGGPGASQARHEGALVASCRDSFHNSPRKLPCYSRDLSAIV